MIGINLEKKTKKSIINTSLIEKIRPDIIDRNGELLATDIIVSSLFANPQKIENVENTLDELSLVFSNLNLKKIRKRLNSNAQFVWIKREITEKQKAKIRKLGILGVFFIKERKRCYPFGNLVSHIIGHVNIDHIGQSGLESFVNFLKAEKIQKYKQINISKTYKPLVSSIDLNIQFIVYDELFKAIKKFDAIAGMASILDINTGEVISMVSLPDYDSNHPIQSLDKIRMNRVTGGIYELGSVLKLLTMGMGLDYNVITLNSIYNAINPLKIGNKLINDYHGKKRYLTVPEIFKYSSNIGIAKIALEVGAKRQQNFLKKINLLDKLKIELSGSAKPQYPSLKRWKKINVVTISYGHGIAITPLQGVVASASMLNGGYFIEPTFLKRTQEEVNYSRYRVIKPKTSKDLIYLMRLNVLEGSGKKAEVSGYLVGGKTGTANKPIKGGYSKSKLISSFLSVFPTNKPKYIMMISLDEPQGIPETYNFRSAGWNAAPTTSKIIKRIIPLLGITFKFNNK